MSFDAQFSSRQLVLEGFGAKAQRKLARSKVLVVGLGGTGSVAATNLALAGVGHLVLVDRDVISRENLHRQPIYTLTDVGMSKAEVAARYLRERSPGIDVEYAAENLDDANVSRLVEGADLVLDCLDNMAARRSLNRECTRRRVPLVHTGSIGWDASIAVFHSPETACLECLFPDFSDDGLPTCETAGALGAVTSYAASVGSLEAIKLVAGIEPSLLGRMLVFDGGTGETRIVPLEKRSGCESCDRLAVKVRKARVVMLCGGEEFYIPRALSSREFVRLKARLGDHGKSMGDSVILAADGPRKISVFKRGGALVRGASSPEEAMKAFNGLLRTAASGNA